MVEVRRRGGSSPILEDTQGAFVHIVTWATNAEHYRRKADLVIGSLGNLAVTAVSDAETVNDRRRRARGELDATIEDLIARAQSNPNAILYGTFHTFEKDDA